MRTWCSEEYTGLTSTSDFQVQIWMQTFLLHFIWTKDLENMKNTRPYTNSMVWGLQ